jgi:hypothetical protein
MPPFCWTLGRLIGNIVRGDIGSVSMLPECVTPVGSDGFTIRRKLTKAYRQSLFCFKPSTWGTTRNCIIPRTRRRGVDLPARIDTCWGLPLLPVLGIRAECFGLIRLKQEGVDVW